MTNDEAAHRKWWRRLSTPILIIAAALALAVMIFSLYFNQERNNKQKDNQVAGGIPSKAPYELTAKLNGPPLNFNNDLTITLIDIKPQGQTGKYQVWAKVFVSGEQEMKIRAIEGYTVVYPTEHGYTIGLIKAEADSARFSIVKNP